ncbi:MAG: ATP-binding cassette domain-containing protein [Rubrivivax sp.]
MGAPLLHVQRLVKRYGRGWPRATTTFELQAELQIDEPAVIGVLGANGAGKTTLFELITGGNQPTEGRVLVAGQDIHRVRYGERGRMALHYHQSYQLRRFRRTRPAFMLERACMPQAVVHLFDEPQFNTQDGYIGFMLDFFKRLREAGKLVFLCVHPNEPVHLDILQQVCERYLFVHKDRQQISRLQQVASMPALLSLPAAVDYLGALVPSVDWPNPSGATLGLTSGLTPGPHKS